MRRHMLAKVCPFLFLLAAFAGRCIAQTTHPRKDENVVALPTTSHQTTNCIAYNNENTAYAISQKPEPNLALLLNSIPVFRVSKVIAYGPS